MPAYAPHSRLTVAGSWEGDPSEIWEWTLSLVASGGSGYVADPTQFLAAIAPAVSAFHSAPGSAIPPEAQLETLKIANIAASGKYDGIATIYDYSPTVSGGLNGQGNCGIECLAISLQTAVPRGPGSRGRFYPPNAGFPVQAQPSPGGSRFLVPAANVTAALTAARTMVNAILGTNDAEIVVASRVNATNSVVTELSMNDVMDTQRRRKNKIKGVRQTVTV